jgi:hypothetical protein
VELPGTCDSLAVVILLDHPMLLTMLLAECQNAGDDCCQLQVDVPKTLVFDRLKTKVPLECRMSLLGSTFDKLEEQKLLVLLLQNFRTMAFDENDRERSKFDVSLLETLETMVVARRVKTLPEIHRVIQSIFTPLGVSKVFGKSVIRKFANHDEISIFVLKLHNAPAGPQFLQCQFIINRILSHFADAYSQQWLSHLLFSFGNSVRNGEELCKIASRPDSTDAARSE